MYTALFHVLIAIYYVPFAPLGLLEAGAHLTDAPFKQVLRLWCGMRKLTVCATRARPILWVIIHVIIDDSHNHNLCKYECK